GALGTPRPQNTPRAAPKSCSERPGPPFLHPLSPPRVPPRPAPSLGAGRRRRPVREAGRHHGRPGADGLRGRARGVLQRAAAAGQQAGHRRQQPLPPPLLLLLRRRAPPRRRLRGFSSHRAPVLRQPAGLRRRRRGGAGRGERRCRSQAAHPAGPRRREAAGCPRAVPGPGRLPAAAARPPHLRAGAAPAARPFVQCFAEADREIAALARRWGCPVLSLDSDFCVFDLPGGYCPLSRFQWQEVCPAEGAPGCFIPALCFSADGFCRRFGRLQKNLLPLFAVLCGNDYGEVPALQGFFGKLPVRAGSPGGRRGKHGLMRGLLEWLAQFGEPAEAVEDVVRHLKAQRREEVRQLLHSSMEDYAPADVNLEDFFQLGKYESEEASSSGLPQWVLDGLAKGELSPFLSDALMLRSTFLHVQVENMQRPSAHSTALPIRQVIYGLLLKAAHSSEAAAASKQANKPPGVFEFDRSQKTLTKTFVQAAANLPPRFCDEHFALEKLTEVPMSCRRMLLLETLGVKMSFLESFPSHLQLPVAVTCYWTQFRTKSKIASIKGSTSNDSIRRT
uniref:Protein asteroid-like protein 1 n=1 Tax=Anas platyrhynchos TaxID=8839 RepID=A0A8B9ZGV1_ANAPL